MCCLVPEQMCLSSSMYVWLACRQYLKHNFRHYRNCSIHSRRTGNRFGRLLYLLGQSVSLKRCAKYKELIMLPEEYFQQSIESHIFGAKIDPFYTFAAAIYMLASLVHSKPESNSDVVSLFPMPLDTRVIQSHSLAQLHPLASLNIFFRGLFSLKE